MSNDKWKKIPKVKDVEREQFYKRIGAQRHQMSSKRHATTLYSEYKNSRAQYVMTFADFKALKPKCREKYWKSEN